MHRSTYEAEIRHNHPKVWKIYQALLEVKYQERQKDERKALAAAEEQLRKETERTKIDEEINQSHCPIQSRQWNIGNNQ